MYYLEETKECENETFKARQTHIRSFRRFTALAKIAWHANATAFKLQTKHIPFILEEAFSKVSLSTPSREVQHCNIITEMNGDVNIFSGPSVWSTYDY